MRKAAALARLRRKILQPDVAVADELAGLHTFAAVDLQGDVAFGGEAGGVLARWLIRVEDQLDLEETARGGAVHPQGLGAAGLACHH